MEKGLVEDQLVKVSVLYYTILLYICFVLFSGEIIGVGVLVCVVLATEMYLNGHHILFCFDLTNLATG